MYVASPEPDNIPSRVIALAGGALAIALVAALVVTLTPARSNQSTTAIGSTTTPVSALRSSDSSAIAVAEALRTNQLDDVTAIPNAIADIPAVALRSGNSTTANSAVLPDLDDTVTVITDQYAYPVAWRDVTRLDVTDGIVVDADGAIVARITEGRLVVSHDLLVGGVLSAD